MLPSQSTHSGHPLHPTTVAHSMYLLPQAPYTLYALYAPYPTHQCFLLILITLDDLPNLLTLCTFFILYTPSQSVLPSQSANPGHRLVLRLLHILCNYSPQHPTDSIHSTLYILHTSAFLHIRITFRDLPNLLTVCTLLILYTPIFCAFFTPHTSWSSYFMQLIP